MMIKNAGLGYKTTAAEHVEKASEHVDKAAQEVDKAAKLVGKIEHIDKLHDKFTLRPEFFLFFVLPTLPTQFFEN